MAAAITLPNDLQTQLEEIAHEEKRTVPEIVREATERYIAHRHLDQLSLRGAARAKKLGLSEKDVPRLIRETRSEPQR
jgi:predicted DNA-binding protein